MIIFCFQKEKNFIFALEQKILCLVCIHLWSSVWGSMIHKHTGRWLTREHISHILELREILLSFQTGFSLVNAAVVCAILESISGLELSSVITEPRYLKLVTVSGFCSFTLCWCHWWCLSSAWSSQHWSPKKKRSHGNEVLLQDTTHLIQRPCYQRGSSCQDPAGSQTTWRPPDHHKEMQATVVWSCLQSSILQGTVKGGRRQGRQRKKLKDNIREWTGLEFAKSQRAVENCEKWRKLVVKSSVVPQWPSWLRDR